MSEVRLVIRDAQQAIEANPHGGFAARVLAALSAEPETIEELDAALERFIAPGEEAYFWGFYPASEDDQGYDAGLVVVDLAARLVVCDSTYLDATREGSVDYHDSKCATDIRVKYHLSDDWLFTSEAIDWPALAEERRKIRQADLPLDVRAVLYGDALLRFIADECFAEFADKRCLEACGPNPGEMPPPAAPAVPAAAGPEPEVAASFVGRTAVEDPEADSKAAGIVNQREYDVIQGIHVRWMMTPREDLRGTTPRQAMLSRHRFTEAGLQDREEQWSLTDQCPPGLDPNCAAYRLAGFGTHEVVVYYDLVRELLWRCHGDLAKSLDGPSSAGLTRENFVAGEIPRLARLREQWLDAPYSDLGGRTARSVIHNERARIPEGESGAEAMIDDDCPLCQMQAELPGPVFWHLDGSHMDDDFAFSIWHETREEWEQERQHWDDFNRRFSAVSAEKERLGAKFPGSGYCDPDVAWRMSFSTAHCGDEPLLTRLFTVGSHLSELIVDLKDPASEVSSHSAASPSEEPPNGELIERLRKAYRSLGDTVRSPQPGRTDAEARFILVDFCDGVDAVRALRSDLALKCVDLRERLQRFLEPPSDEHDPPNLFRDDCAPS